MYNYPGIEKQLVPQGNGLYHCKYSECKHEGTVLSYLNGTLRIPEMCYKRITNSR